MTWLNVKHSLFQYKKNVKVNYIIFFKGYAEKTKYRAQ